MKHVLNFILLVVLGSCVEPFVFEQGVASDLLVVYGVITDQPGPYTITLTGSLPINGNRITPEVTGAHVTVTSDAGETEELVERQGGAYLTTSLQGVVGRSYTLHITTADGAEYESLPDKMLPVGKFYNLHSKFIQNVLPDSNEPPYNDPIGSRDDNPLAEILNGFNLIINTEFDPLQEGRAVWRWSGVFEYVTTPEGHGRLQGKEFIPEPYPCSGYTYDYFRKVMIKRHPCTCCVCYHTQHNPRPIVSDPRYVRDNKLDSFAVAFIPANPFTLHKKYFISVEQSSASEQEYAFWKRVQAADQQGSDFFQTPPPAASGNIKALSGGGKAVIGLFAAHAVHRDTISLFPSQVPYIIRAPVTGNGPCYQLYEREVTSVKPPFY